MSGSGLFSNQQAAIPHTVPREVKDLRDDVRRTLAPLMAVTVEELTAPVATNTAGLKAATTTVAAAVTVSSFLSGANGTGALSAYPRSIKFTTTDVAGGGDTSADAPATATVTGKDVNGSVQSETVNLGQTDGSTVETTKCYSVLTSVTYPAAQGTGAKVAIGIGVKVGFAKKLKPRAGLTGLMREVVGGELALPPADIAVDEWINPAAPAADGLLAATTVEETPVTVLAAALESAGLAVLLAHPRNVTFTTSGNTPSDAPATALITGTDINDAVLTETVDLAQTATIAEGVKAFKTIVSVVFAAGEGTDAAVAIGFGKKLGLSRPLKFRAGATDVLQEIAAGTVVTDGTFVLPATSPPNGTYSPNTDPDASNDYAVYYEAASDAGSTIEDPDESAPNGAYTPAAAFDGSRNYCLVYEYDPTA